jgi:hypothetical protein
MGNRAGKESTQPIAQAEGRATMVGNDVMKGPVGWLATVAAGVLLSVKVARLVTESIGHGHADEPVREMVEEVLSEHREEDRPIVQAFAEAL